MNITFIQTELAWEGRVKNLLHFQSKVDEIHTVTDLIVLPEMFSTGFSMNASHLAEDMNGKTVNWMKAISKQKSCAITGSVIIHENGYYFNRLIWVNGEEIKTYDKRHLFSYAKEEETYTAGKEKLIIDYKGWKICLLVCYDLRFPVWSRRTKEADYDLLIYVANWPERRSFAWKNLLPARAIENQSYVLGLNRIGNDGHHVYHSGDSALYNFRGEIFSSTKAHEDAIETIALDKEALMEFRKQFAFFQDGDTFEILK